MFLTLAFFETLVIIALIFAWREEKKHHRLDEITHHLHEEEIFNKVAIQLDAVDEKIDAVIAKGRRFLVDDRREKLSIAALTGRSHHVMCLIDDDVEVYLYSYIESLKRGIGDYDKRSHLEQIIRQFIFVPIPFRKGDLSTMPVVFDQLNYTTTTSGNWVAKVWGIEFSLYENKRVQHLVQLNKIPKLRDDTTPVPYKMYHVSWHYIFPEDWHVFRDIDELTSFFEELHNEDKVLRQFLNSKAVYKDLLLPSVKGIVFDPEWLANRKEE